MIVVIARSAATKQFIDNKCYAELHFASVASLSLCYVCTAMFSAGSACVALKAKLCFEQVGRLVSTFDAAGRYAEQGIGYAELRCASVASALRASQ
jgi:hypothetical protein